MILCVGYISLNLGSLSISRLWVIVVKVSLFLGLYINIYGSICGEGLLLCRAFLKFYFTSSRTPRLIPFSMS